MGKSAKLHKRPKNLKKPTTGATAGTSIVGGAQAQAQSAKKKAGLKQKAANKGNAGESANAHVLGGADYVSLMMGSRKKAREEAAKLPRNQ